MFSQAAPALDRSQGGLGIGLSLVRGLVEMHGGTVVAQSDGPGKGSEFTVRLPLASPLPAHEPQRAEFTAKTPGASCKVLVADDNPDSAASLAGLLQMMGNEVRSAYDGQEAVEAAQSYQPDVVLLDIGMPRLNGYDAARLIREQPWGKPMILVALTGWGQEEDKRRSREAGFDAHMTKPVDPQSLVKFLGFVGSRKQGGPSSEL
jgi:CheY-like chemotaxis protein